MLGPTAFPELLVALKPSLKEQRSLPRDDDGIAQSFRCHLVVGHRLAEVGRTAAFHAHNGIVEQERVVGEGSEDEGIDIEVDTAVLEQTCKGVSKDPRF